MLEFNGDGNRPCLAAYSSSELGADAKPRWRLLHAECFTRGLPYQGLFSQWGDVLFTGTKKNGAYVLGSELSHASSSGHVMQDLSR